MENISSFFPANTSKEGLLAVQRLIAKRSVARDDFGEINLIAGVDNAFIHDKIISGIIVLYRGSFEVKEREWTVQTLDFPYIPTFLSFREGLAILNAFKKLKIAPDILMVDGAGINHPRRAGIATHIGVALDVPTIGITKKILCGSGEEPDKVNEASPLVFHGEKVGWLLKSTKRSRPIIVAPGHRVSLHSSLSIVRSCLRGHKLPEPARLAHEYVNSVKNSMKV